MNLDQMKKFSIIKRAYIWLILAVCIAVCGWVVFFMTANYSEEFTGWVSISINTQTDSEEIQTSLKNFLTENDYGQTTVHVNTT